MDSPLYLLLVTLLRLVPGQSRPNLFTHCLVGKKINKPHVDNNNVLNLNTTLLAVKSKVGGYSPVYCRKDNVN